MSGVLDALPSIRQHRPIARQASDRPEIHPELISAGLASVLIGSEGWRAQVQKWIEQHNHHLGTALADVRSRNFDGAFEHMMKADALADAITAPYAAARMEMSVDIYSDLQPAGLNKILK